ncbi:amino acid adenylation domain-containing protein [Microbacteriaceae bacterium VKM Ac-2854]|nr:amino acid adenylation domain-containing protein [Microbacteriaceae bacterium VKM Ac-2854]
MTPIPDDDGTARADDHPLTPAQLALYLHARTHPGDASLNLGFAYRLDPGTDPERLAASIRTVLAASAALSTVFVETAEGPVARVFRPGHRRHEVPLLVSPGSDDAVAASVAREADSPIAPEAWPQPRCTVYTSADGAWLGVVTSHLVADATTHERFRAAVAAAYRGASLPAGLDAHPATVPRRVDSVRAQAFFAASLASPPESVLAVEPTDVRHETRLRLARPDGDASLTAQLTAAHAIVIAALSGRDDVVVGVPIAGRSTRAAREALGCFVRTVPLPIRLGAHASIAELQSWLELRLTGLLRHQDADVGSFGGFDNTITVYRRPLALPLGAAVALPLPRRTLAAAVQLSVTPAAGALDVVVAVPDRLAGHGVGTMFAAALRADRDSAPAGVAAALAAEPSVTPVRRRYPVLGGIAEAVLAAGAADPHRIAVADERGSITAAELAARVEAAAAAIERMGADRYLGVAMPPGIDLVITVLGILRAGRAYVPLDPDGPPERGRRIRSVVADAQGAELRVLRAAPWSPGALAARAQPDDPAYVIFTSGSTGEPKGVEVSHRAVLRLLAATRELVDPRPSDRWCLFHSAAFDFSVWELFGSLAAGARLCIPDRATVADPLATARFLREHDVSVLNQTPSAFRRQLDAGAELPAVRLVLFGGEELEPRLVQRMPGGARFVDLYGITEATVHVTAHAVDGTRSIGRPLADLGVAVVDARLRSVPRGVSGELLVWGDGLALGYLARPEATAERFRTDTSFAERVLRTGDRVRMRLDGTLEYLGRLDRQRRLRGHRVEPGEVEAALRALPGVRDAVVALAEPSGRQPFLAAWLAGDADPSAARSALAARLPAVMVPAVIERIDAVPLTANGKVDEAALLAALFSGLRRATTAPGTAAERIADVFARVIGVPSVNVDSAFFDAGGTSMHLVELSRALRAELGIETRMVDLFEHPSPRSLAAWSAPARPARRASDLGAFWSALE